jgi:DMSO/TMAO reductase YedYZ molybdopterin-dependent catalytic subunit
MKKRSQIASISLVIVIAAAIVATLYYGTLPAKSLLPSGEPAQWQISVTGAVEQDRTWSLKDMTNMPLTEVTTMTNGDNETYLGVSLLEFCNQSSIRWDAGSINVIGVSGQRATLSVFQAWNSTAYPRYQIRNRIVLAFTRNGQWLTNETGGPVRLVTPGFGAKYQVDGVAQVDIGLWTVSVSGAVSNPLTFTGENMTNFQQKTIESEFAPGDSPEVTANWTGLSMSSVLRTSRMSNEARMITVIAIDGYEENFTIQQINDTQMLVGFKENTKYLTLDQGGPFRLFLPVNEYKWGYRWVKFLSRIVVS